jgi:uncharacterized tellurite resistance protein B-like protein
MGETFLERVRAFLEGNASVRRVADDTALTSELVLLLRMTMADGELREDEYERFRRLAMTAFAIPEADVGEVIGYLKDFAYDLTAEKAAAQFAELTDERKRSLLLHMLEIAKADNELHADEAELIRRTAAILGLDPGRR